MIGWNSSTCQHCKRPFFFLKIGDVSQLKEIAVNKMRELWVLDQ